MPPDASDSPAPGGAFGPPLWLVVLSAAIPVTAVAAWVVAKEKKMAKRKRGLSGSPLHHSEESSVARSYALRHFRSAARAPSCRAAFAQILTGDEFYAEADVHAREASARDRDGKTLAWRDDNLKPALEAKQIAIARFKDMCLKSDVSLSGLRRRKARR